MIKPLKCMSCMLIIISFFQVVSADYGFDAQVNGEPDSIGIGDLEYGGSKSISLKVINNNEKSSLNLLRGYCALYCSYEVDGGLEGTFAKLQAGGDDDIKQFNIVAPNKGKDSTLRTYKINFLCSRDDEGACSSWSGKKEIPVTVEFTLNPQQREAKAFIEGALTILNEDIKEADMKIKKPESKLNSLPSNIKLGSLSSEISSVRNKHNLLKTSVEEIDRIAKEEFDYVLAKNKYNSNLPIGISSNADSAEKLEEELNNLIGLHNNISDRINLLGNKNKNINSKLTLLNEVNPINKEIESLVNDFKLGNFQSYQEIEWRIDYYESELDKIYNQASEKVEKVKLTGNSILTDEYESLCDKYGFCQNTQQFETIEGVCSSLSKLQGKVIAENDNRKDNLSKTQDSNEDIEVEPKGLLEKIVGFFRNILGFGGKITGNTADIFSKEDKVIELSDDYKGYVTENCNFEVKNYEFEQLEKVNVNVGEVTGQGIKETEESAGQCCLGGTCTECCIGDECDDPSLYPVVFVHGHSALSLNSLDYSIRAFEPFGEKMASEEGYITMGVLLPESDINKIEPGAWGAIKKPVSVRVTYYKGVYDENGRTIGKEQDKSIDEYSQRLEDTVNTILHHTGRDKVIIVAHSMGGLVSRNYIKNYDGSGLCVN